MSDKPILFSDPMVRAILSGQKVQTRRVVKMQPRSRADVGSYGSGMPFIRNPDSAGKNLDCPYGQPGDRLWVREAWGLTGSAANIRLADYEHPESVFKRDHLIHRATAEAYDLTVQHWRPSIHMPRWACRLVLEIVSVRVERLQDISEADALAEGVESPDTERTEHDERICPQCGGTRLYTAHSIDGARPDTDCDQCDTNAKRFRHLWQSINGAESLAANPWVWVIEFRRVPT